MKRIFKNYVMIMVIAIIASCTNEELYVGDTNISVQNNSDIVFPSIPFADEQSLQEIASNPVNISYGVARKLTAVEMELGIKETMDWYGAKLSEKPVVIYDGKSNAKYYEFIVSDQQGKELGTITTYAQKKADMVVAYVLPFVRDYSALNTKGNNYRLINGGYPSRVLLGVIGKSGEEPSAIIDPETSETVTSVPSDDTQSLIDALANLSEEEKASFNITDVSVIIDEVQQKDIQNKENAEEFWEIIDSMTSEIESTSDEDIISTVNESKSEWTSYDTYRIPAFYNNGMYYTRWNGWCGPSAIAWIYRGLYSSYYNGSYIPLYGSSSFARGALRVISNSRGSYVFSSSADSDNDKIRNDLDKDWVNAQSASSDGGLYAKIAEKSGLYSYRWLASNDGITFPSGLSSALSTVTNGVYALSGAYVTAGHDHIRSKKLPTILVVDNLSHYVVAFGSEYRYWNWDIYFKIFGKKITISKGSIKTGTWALVHDNGYMTAKYGYAPYWRGEVLGLDISYRVLKLK
jgi:hypothetical protein